MIKSMLSKNNTYQIYIGLNSLKILPKKLKKICPKAKKLAFIVDKKVPKIIVKKIISKFNNYETICIYFLASEKNKSVRTAISITDKLLKKRFNRSDVLLGIGGGITGDTSSFAASIIKRGINFINIPTTFLSQVDASIGGKTGVNSIYGKNLIGSFYQPKLVLIDTLFLRSLKRRDMICGFAEILKHSIIKDRKFFNWLEKNAKSIIDDRTDKKITESIFKSCKIKLDIIKNDLNERNERMKLNFGHTFAHAIEAKNKFSKKINHGEAVLIGMLLATKLSVQKKICSKENLKKIERVYKDLKIDYLLKKTINKRDLIKLIYYMKSDKKNFSDKINLILLKKIGKVTTPGNFQISSQNLHSNLMKII